MSALARYFNHIGKNVAGYDRTASPLTLELAGMGMDIHYEDNLSLVPVNFMDRTGTLIVYTPAVPKDHSEYGYFVKNGFEVKKRSEVLGLVTKDTFCFAVAGTHGKTTTSSILAHLLKETGTPVTAFLGGISENFNSNFLLEGTEYSVVEADEFDRSFLRLSPNVACITSMDADHLDIYGDGEALKRSFMDFAARVRPNGKMFVHSGLPIQGQTYGLEDGSDFSIRNIKVEGGVYEFDIRTPDTVLKNVRFAKPGRHNLLNALAAFSMALESGAPADRLANALLTFKGVQRRFSYRVRNGNFVFIDDYAHHPSEIDAVRQAVTEMHPDKKVLAIFQPHLFSRTRDFSDDFAASLSKFDSVILLDIYPARESPLEGIDSEWLLAKIDNPSKKLLKKSDLATEIRKQAPDILVMMGAGDIGLEVPKIKNELGYAN